MLVTFAQITSNAAAASLGISALNALNELLSRNYVPAQFENFLLQLFKYIFSLLSNIAQLNSLENADPEYVVFLVN